MSAPRAWNSRRSFCWHWLAYWPQVRRVCLAWQAGLAGQDPARASRSGSVNTDSTKATAVDVDMVALGSSRVGLRSGERWARQGSAAMSHLTNKPGG